MQSSHGKGFAAVFPQDFGHLDAAVSVSIGFYHADKLSVTDFALYIFNVEVKIIKVDFRPGRPQSVFIHISRKLLSSFANLLLLLYMLLVKFSRLRRKLKLFY